MTLTPERIAWLRSRPTAEERAALERALLAGMKRERAALEKLRVLMSGEWGYEDTVYRFYHQSMKVHDRAQGPTCEAVELFRKVLPERKLHEWFERIVADGAVGPFKMEHNDLWLEVTRPILEAFFHAKYFVEMMCRYADELEEPPNLMPSGWAAILYLYDLRF